MRNFTHLPVSLGEQFSLAQARSRGVSRARADARDLARPFHGIRSREEPSTFLARVQCYLPRMRSGQRFIGRTAVRLWALPFPVRWRAEEAIEVACAHQQSPPRTRGVRGRRLGAQRADTWSVQAAPVVDPVSAVFSCAAELTVRQIVVLLDAVISTADNYPGAASVPRPVVNRGDVERRLAEWGTFAGSGRVRAATARMRERVESPKETEVRLTIADAGLPEPVVQCEVRNDGSLVARTDLAYPVWRIAIEYEGDGHRVDRAQWRRDVARQRDLEDLGWAVIRVTQQDLDDPRGFRRRLSRLIEARRGSMDH